MFCCKNRELFNILMMSTSFLLLYGSFSTSSMFMTLVLNSEKIKTNGTFTGNGYMSLSIIYATFSIVTWFAPVIVLWLTPKYALFIVPIVFSVYIFSFLKPNTIALYVLSVFIGIGNATLGIAHGTFISVNSNSKTMSRNTTIYWTFFHFSMIVGNTIEYCLFREANEITDEKRITLYSIFGVGSLISAIFPLFIRQNHQIDNYRNIDHQKSPLPENTEITPLQAFLRAFYLCKSKRMLLLFSTFIYMGFQTSFLSGVFGTAVGQTKIFGDKAKGYVALIGIAIGVGEILCCLIIHRLSSYFRKFTGDLIMIVGLFMLILCFYLIFLSLPYNSTQIPSSEMTYITPKLSVILLCGFLLGAGDCIFNTQIISILGLSYKGADNPSAFTLFKFIQNAASGVGFFYTQYLNLNWQLLILCVTLIISTITFLVNFKINTAEELNLTVNLESTNYSSINNE